MNAQTAHMAPPPPRRPNFKFALSTLQFAIPSHARNFAPTSL
ncbi:hypothetical protein RESH_02936 [Rhodopirellula europaea SH398]|uniref:Uncharacterized protein n=1 Tax=Rhodopirellula europaea SH398 TaxID=1263868 RepID=M5S4Q2_9BACT|nr:hypothetical protein RESH_02936 [Rhodopirellula europaea SH398]